VPINLNRRTRYIPTLDGWRALSVIAVLFDHGGPSFFAGYPRLMHVSSHGNIGVDIFFAISGFLICGLLIEEFARTGDIHLRGFYIRRCFRILPPYYATLAVICALSVVSALPVNYSDLPSCLFFYRNYLPLGVDRHGGFYTAHFWSLAVEEHFYLLWPSLLIALKPKRAAKVAFVLAMLVFGWREMQLHAWLFPRMFVVPNAWTGTDTRIDALLWGCLAAIYLPTIRRTFERLRGLQFWLPTLAVLLVLEVMHAPEMPLWHAILLPLLVVSTVIQPGSFLGRILEWPPLCWIGTLSYSLYLWQELFLPQEPMKARGAFHNLQQWPWNIPAILICAVLSRYLIEIPMTRLGHRLSASFRTLPPPVQERDSVLVVMPDRAAGNTKASSW
jgi:peptidoglycan/LPS O-acetylase OafA/YrhL